MKKRAMRTLNSIVLKMYMNKIFIIIKLKMKEKKSLGEQLVKKKERSLSARSM